MNTTPLTPQDNRVTNAELFSQSFQFGYTAFGQSHPLLSQVTEGIGVTKAENRSLPACGEQLSVTADWRGSAGDVELRLPKKLAASLLWALFF